MMTATQLTVLQNCARKAVLEREWRVRKWRPRALFNDCLERLVINIGVGKDAEKCGLEAYTQFMQRANNPGLDLAYGIAPYDLACDFAWALRVVAELLKRIVMLPMRQMIPPVQLVPATDYYWLPESMADESGALHWWHAVERFDQNELTRQGHAWRWGDMAACEVPLTLHLIEIGYLRNGHLHGDLTRIFQHPSVSKYKFRHQNGKALEGWKALWLQDTYEKIPLKRWCDLMTEDLVAPVHHIMLKQPEPWQREEFVFEVAAETNRLESLPKDWRKVPKSRAACDLFGGCPYQPLCFGPQDASPEKMGAYVQRS